MEERFAFVCEPVVDDPESDWTVYISKDREKALAYAQRRKERKHIEFYEVEVSPSEKISQTNACFSCDRNGKPVKLWVDEERKQDDDDVPCDICIIY